MLDASIKMNLINFKRMVSVSIQRKNIKLLKAYFKTFRRRKSPIANHFGGSQWWAFSFDTLFKVHTFIENNSDFVSYHKNTLLPDELFFHTNIRFLMEKDNSIRVKNALTYVNWSRNNGKFPVVFNESNSEELLQQSANNMLFARKFDMDYCGKILNILDNNQLV